MLLLEIDCELSSAGCRPFSETRLITTLLFAVSPTDPATFAGVAMIQ